MSLSGDDIDFARLIEPVARALLGEPNSRLSKKSHLRFGTSGSLDVDLEKGTWYSFEDESGGGVLDLIKRIKGLERGDAVQWLKDCGFAYDNHSQADAKKATSKGDSSGARQVEAGHWDYTDENGATLLRVTRIEFQLLDGSFLTKDDGKRKKTFRQSRPDPEHPGCWIKNAVGVPSVPYRLGELLADIGEDRFVCIVEGELKVDLLRNQWNVPATCSAGGSRKWLPEHAAYFEGAHAVILPDNDPAGRAHADVVGASLIEIAATVRVLELPDLPPKGDIVDWIKAGHTREEFDALIDSAARPWKAQLNGHEISGGGGYIQDARGLREQAPTPVELPPARPWWRDPVAIPQRQKLYGDHYVRGAIGATIALGGRAKTTLGCLEAVSMATGRDLLTGQLIPGGPLRVVTWNGEESQNELDRRVAAVCQHYGVTEQDLDERLFAISVQDWPMRIATLEKGTPKIQEGMLGAIKRFLAGNRIDVFMIDPFVSFHGVIESDNMHMDLVIKQGFGAIARETNTAGEVFHHPGKLKPGQAETTVEDGRGASSILYAVRSARVLNFMTVADAEKFGMNDDERKRHIRIANGKANMGPTGRAKWMRIEVVDLPNGDQVACASSWSPPNPFEDVTTTDMELARGLARTGAYKADRRSPEWFGYALAKQLDLDVHYRGDNDPKDIAKLKGIIATWLKNGVLRTEKRRDEGRKEREYIVADGAENAAQAAQYSDDDEIRL